MALYTQFFGEVENNLAYLIMGSSLFYQRSVACARRLATWLADRPLPGQLADRLAGQLASVPCLFLPGWQAKQMAGQLVTQLASHDHQAYNFVPQTVFTLGDSGGLRVRGDLPTLFGVQLAQMLKN